MAELPSHTDITEYELFVLYIIPSCIEYIMCLQEKRVVVVLYLVTKKQLKSSKNSNRTF